MNIERKKTCLRYLVWSLFWTIIIIMSILLIPGGGSGGSGPGSGSGTHGSGTGRGSGTHGDGTGSSNDGTNDQATVDGPASSVAEAATVAPAETAAPAASTAVPVKKVQPQVAKDAPIKIMSDAEASDDVATIYLPGKSGGSGSGSGTSTGFFGVEISGPVIFLLDISGSMAASSGDGNLTRLELVKKEISNTLKRKFEESKKKRNKDHFRIVCFDDSCIFAPEADKRGLRFDSTSNIMEANRFVQTLQPRGGTGMMMAWNSIIPIIKREEIQSVYFLSDGEPNDCRPEDLLAFLKQSVLKLRIHTISMGQSSQLLKDIAKQHNGQYREVF